MTISHDLPPERQLIAAIILQALFDARAGCAEAADFMDTVAPMLAAVGLGVPAKRMRMWRIVSLPRGHARTTPPAAATRPKRKR